jgi:hypothetical protein
MRPATDKYPAHPCHPRHPWLGGTSFCPRWAKYKRNKTKQKTKKGKK